jgi:hypothetical protein
MVGVWREGIKIECTEGGNISDISVSNIQMKNVRRPIFIILNNRFELNDYGTSVELEQMPQIGTISRIFFSNIHIIDEEEMLNTNYRFGNDVMGSPKFADIRVDANREHPIQDCYFSQIFYNFIGGVNISDIPDKYPYVADRIKEPMYKSSENYYPDWSRARFIDIRNVNQLSMDGIYLKNIYEDERVPVLIENCIILVRKIYLDGECEL